MTKKFTFPPQEEMERVRKRIAYPNHRRTNIFLTPWATPLEKAKHKICQNISSYQEKNNFSEKQLFQKLGVTKKEGEYILFCHIDKFTLDELIYYANRLYIPCEVKIKLPYEQEKTAAEAY